MSKMSDLAYDIEQLYIEGHNPHTIARQLNCSVELVKDWMSEVGVESKPEACYVMDCDPYSTINS